MKKIEIFCDASCDNNSKLKMMGLGVAVFINDLRSEKDDVCEMCGTNGTNNIAEYLGFKAALEKVKQLNTLFEGRCYFMINSDSKLVVEQWKGRWDCNQPHLNELLTDCKDFRRTMDIPSSRLRVQWISRVYNQEADFLSKKAVTEYIKNLEN